MQLLNIEQLSGIMSIVKDAVFLLGVIVPIVVWIRRIVDGVQCQLRTEMLRIYYHNKDREKIRQYEYENFVHLYKAYKALKGNSFIDKIYEEVKTWEVIT